MKNILCLLVLPLIVFSCSSEVNPKKSTGFIEFKINGEQKRFEGTPYYAIHTSSGRKLISFKATETNDPNSAIFSAGIEDPEEVQVGDYNSVFQGYAPPRPSVNAGFEDNPKNISYGTAYNDPDKAIFYMKVSYIDNERIEGTFYGKFTNENNLNELIDISEGKFEFRP